MKADPGKVAGILAIAGKEFHKNGQKVVLSRTAFEEEMQRDIRNELILMRSNDIAEVYVANGEFYLDINKDEMRSAIFEREKLNRSYDGNIEKLVENESPTQLDLEYPDSEPVLTDSEDLQETEEGEFHYSDPPGLIATLGCFGQERREFSEYEVFGYLEEDATPHLALLNQTGYLRKNEDFGSAFYSITEERYKRDAERIHQYLKEEYNLNIEEFREDFDEIKALLDSQLETMNLALI